MPSHTLRGSVTYRLPGMPQARVGSRVQWQSATEADGNSRVRQSAYALVDLMGSYTFDENWSASLNLNNVFDEKYYERSYSNYWVNPGEPRNFTVSLTLNL